MTQLTIPMTADSWLDTQAQLDQAGLRSRVVSPYRIGPVAVNLHTDIPEVQAGFDQLYRPYRVSAGPRDAFRIEVIAGRSWTSLRRRFDILANGERLFTVNHRDQVIPYIEWSLNSLVINHLPGYLQIHASVVSRDGIGVLCPGQPGSGKTTLAAGLLTRGWSYLSDEFALIDPQTGLLEPYPKALCIKSGSFEPLAHIGVPIDPRRTHHKGRKGPVILLDPVQLRPDAVSGPCRIGMVVLPTYQGPGEPAIEPISRARTIFELTRFSFNFCKFRTRGFDLLAEAVSAARCYQLRSGDLAKTCALVEDCLDQLPAEGVGHA